jgi:hypothetical protein
MGPESRGRALHPCRRLVALLTWTPSPLGVFWSKKNHREVLFRLDSVWYSFSARLKNKEKT